MCAQAQKLAEGGGGGLDMGFCVRPPNLPSCALSSPAAARPSLRKACACALATGMQQPEPASGQRHSAAQRTSRVSRRILAMLQATPSLRRMVGLVVKPAAETMKETAVAFSTSSALHGAKRTEGAACCTTRPATTRPGMLTIEEPRLHPLRPLLQQKGNPFVIVSQLGAEACKQAADWLATALLPPPCTP